MSKQRHADAFVMGQLRLGRLGIPGARPRSTELCRYDTQEVFGHKDFELSFRVSSPSWLLDGETTLCTTGTL